MRFDWMSGTSRLLAGRTWPCLLAPTRLNLGRVVSWAAVLLVALAFGVFGDNGPATSSADLRSEGLAVQQPAATLSVGAAVVETQVAAATPSEKDVVQVAPGGQHTCALLSDESVWCWGDNVNGQLGDFTQVDRRRPIPVVNLGPDSGVISLAAGFAHTCALFDTGGVKCWGSSLYGQIGNGTSGVSWLGAVDVCASGSGVGCAGGTPLTGAVEIELGDRHTCARMGDNSVKCWGYNQFGQLGNGASGNESISALPVDCAFTFRRPARGRQHEHLCHHHKHHAQVLGQQLQRTARHRRISKRSSRRARTCALRRLRPMLPVSRYPSTSSGRPV